MYRTRLNVGSCEEKPYKSSKRRRASAIDSKFFRTYCGPSNVCHIGKIAEVIPEVCEPIPPKDETDVTGVADVIFER